MDMTINKCKACGKWIPEFAPSTMYCSKICESTRIKSWIDWVASIDDLRNLFWMN